jgi:hypothetical protein
MAVQPHRAAKRRKGRRKRGSDSSLPIKGRRVNDAARAIGVCRQTLYNLRKIGKIKFVKVAGRTIV